METYIVTAVIIAIVVGFIFFKYRNRTDSIEETSVALNVLSWNKTLEVNRAYGMTVKFESLSALTEKEEARLVEVRDKS